MSEGEKECAFLREETCTGWKESGNHPPWSSGVVRNDACLGKAERQNGEHMGSVDELVVEPVRALWKGLPGLGVEQGWDWMEKIISEPDRRASCPRVFVIHTFTWQPSSLLLFNIIYSQYLPNYVVIHSTASFYVSDLIGLWGKYDDWLHFAQEETEAEGEMGNQLTQDDTVREWLLTSLLNKE